MKKRLLFIFNPRSGKSKIKLYLLDIVDVFTKAGYEVTVYPTQAPGDCAERIRQLDESFSIVVISGGDGTLNEAVTGMLELPKEKRRPIGYIPAGTTNDFASSNGIPKTMINAANAITDGKTICYDIGKFNNSSFVYVAAFGAFTDVPYDTPQISKNLLGHAAYLIEGIKRLPKLTSVSVKIRTVEGEEYDSEVFICLIMNTTSVAGFEISEFYDNIYTNDGVFEIVLIPKTENIIDIATLISDIKNGERNKNGVKVISTKGAEIYTDEKVSWTLDGEFGGKTDHVRFNVMHNAIDFIMHSDDEA